MARVGGVEGTEAGAVPHTFQAYERSLKNATRRFLRLFQQVSFITLHYMYFIATCLVASLVFWGSSTPTQSVRYIDALFLSVSAMTEAGLNTVNLSQLNTWQQVILFLLIMMGSAILVSCAVLHVRKQTFALRLQELADRRQRRLIRPRSFMTSIKSRSRLKSENTTTDADRTAAIASGAVRGLPIPDIDPDAPYEPTRQVQNDLPKEKQPEDSADTEADEAGMENDQDTAHETSSPQTNTHIKFATLPVTSPRTSAPGLSRRVFSNTGVGAHSVGGHPRDVLSFEHADTEPVSIFDVDPAVHRRSSKLSKYIETLSGYTGRNSQFHQLTEEERRKLGGIEYDALCLLSWVVPLYFVLFQLLGALGCGAWMWVNRPDAARQNGLNPFWTGAFFAVSAFNNSGMALLDANATALQTSYYMLLTLSLLILAGNTCFPIFLRLILWTLMRCFPAKTDSSTLAHWRYTLEFILDHPRRVYTNLFPAEATWWLAVSLICLNGIDWLAFEVLNIGNPTTAAIEPKFRVLDGLFQAFAVRAGGFYVVTIAGLYPGTLILYVLMMYLSAFPVTMSIRNTNVYEERSLGIFADEAPASDTESNEQQTSLSRVQSTFDFVRRSTQARKDTTLPFSRAKAASESQSASKSTWTSRDFLRLQLRSQLGHDLWWLSLAVFLITVIETHSVLTDPVNFSIFNILFEVVSAYGTVGISVGVPWSAYSFCGAWHTGSKLVLCAVMLRGRHRGLPVAIDRAILLPDKSLAWAEEEDGQLKRTRSGRSGMRSAYITPVVSRYVPPQTNES